MSGPQHEIKTELSRELTLFQLTMMGLGMMIGAGVFLGIGNAIYHSGPGGVMLTFGLNGVLALFTAMSYAELSSAIPRAGGAFNFARLAFGNGTSFIAGWMEWFASSIAGSMYAITFSIYTLRYFETLGWLPPEVSALLTKPVAVVVALLFLYINFRGVSETGKIGAIMTLGQTLFLVFIAAAGVFVAIKDPSRLANFTPYLPNGWGKLLVTMGFTYVAFEGYEVIAQAGDEAIEPRKNLPKAMILSVTIAALTYIGVSFAAVVAIKAGSEGIEIPWVWIGSFGEKGFGEAVARLIPAGNILLTIAVIFASTSALNSTIFSATRASYALGRDQMLPPFFAKISAKRKTPVGALVCTAGIIIVVAAFLPTMDVASSASIMFLFLFFLVNLCVIRVRNNMGDELKYGFITPLFPLFPILAVIMQAVLAVWLVHMSLIAWIVGPAWILAGIVFYQVYAKHHITLTEDDIHVLYEETPPQTQERRFIERIMIPIANPNNVPKLVDMAQKLSSDEENTTIELLHMVSVPDQLALAEADRYMADGQEGLLAASQLLEKFVTSSTIRYCRNIARGIISTAKENRATMIVMGWHGRHQNSLFTIGSTLDPVICRAPCNVIITKDDITKRTYTKILVPLFGNVNDALAMKTAEYLLPKEGGVITALYFNAARMRPGHIHNILHRIIDNPGIRIEEQASNSRHREQDKTILEATAGHDLMILGIKEPRMHRLGRPSSSERIARSCRSPFLLVKANNPIRRLTKRWL